MKVAPTAGRPSSRVSPQRELSRQPELASWETVARCSRDEEPEAFLQPKLDLGGPT